MVVRREWFGCLCCDLKSGQYFQFNQDGLEVLGLLRKPIELDALLRSLRERGLVIGREAMLDFLNRLSSLDLLADVQSQQGEARFIDHTEGTLEPTHLVAPSSCTIYITDLCPKECLHCITRSSPRLSTVGEYGIEEWNEILERLRAWGVITLIFTGGEPLLKKGIFEILERASSLKFNICLLTDFDGLGEQHITRLKRIASLNYIQTSLDGGTAETHDFIRGAGAFKKTIWRLTLFRDNDIGYTISTVVHKRNIREINLIADIYHEYHARYLYLNPLAPYGRAKGTLQQLVLDEAELKALALIYYRLIASKGVHSGNAFWQNLTYSDATAPDFHPFGNCLHAMSTGSYVMSISSRGECFLDSKMKSEGLLPLGNALQRDFQEMWCDPRLARLRQQHSFQKPALLDVSEVLRILN